MTACIDELLGRSAALTPSTRMLVLRILESALQLAQTANSELEQGFEFPWGHQAFASGLEHISFERFPGGLILSLLD